MYVPGAMIVFPSASLAVALIVALPGAPMEASPAKRTTQRLNDAVDDNADVELRPGNHDLGDRTGTERVPPPFGAS